MQRERRLIHRFSAVWRRLAGDRALPSLKDFTPPHLAPFKSQTLMIDLCDGIDHALLGFVGDQIRIQNPQLSNRSGRQFKLLRDDPLATELAGHIAKVVDQRSPLVVDSVIDGIPYRTIIAPLSSDGEVVDFLLAVISWQNSPDAFDAASDLAGLRLMAETAGRSRLSLYELLASIRDFITSIEDDPDALSELFKDHHIRIQSRARETAILKLVFGRDYDKTRLTEYAAVLSFAHRTKLSGSELFEKLSDQRGGLKALVRAEREARHPAPSGKSPDHLVVRGVIQDWRPQQDQQPGEALKLTGRTNDRGEIEILGILPPTRTVR